jgi:acetyltransferase-like isoleucine patch superfamily enzyme
MKGNLLQLKKENGDLLPVQELPGLTINFNGKKSLIIVEEGAIFHNMKITVADSCRIVIEKTAPRGIWHSNINMEGSPNSELYIGKGCTIENCYFAMANESNQLVKIGVDCMFSTNITIRSTDGHIIYDVDSKKLLNQTKPVVIGNHVWISADVNILKGSSIPDNSIVVTGSVVTRNFLEENIIIAGNPADIIKRNINWHRNYIGNYDQIKHTLASKEKRSTNESLSLKERMRQLLKF